MDKLLSEQSGGGGGGGGGGRRQVKRQKMNKGSQDRNSCGPETSREVDASGATL